YGMGLVIIRRRIGPTLDMQRKQEPDPLLLIVVVLCQLGYSPCFSGDRQCFLPMRGVQVSVFDSEKLHGKIVSKCSIFSRLVKTVREKMYHFFLPDSKMKSAVSAPHLCALNLG